MVKDLATHTRGTVVQQGTVLLTLVPKDDILRAEVWVSNEDIGFVRKGQPVRIKLAAYPFQKYGMLDGELEHVGADAGEPTATAAGSTPGDGGRANGLRYKALVGLRQTQLEIDGERLELAPGMQASAEIHLGRRSVIAYLFSPVQKAWYEKGRER
ncbi:MAG TPA: HlyD family efflux transporter periplasmic adaptor subunit [Accumulibacter sp.]|uniref:HlyD family efflux transporter periplasmic adaptor subunit n=1 Tax=Accumulibacter sp. TaxID=2053492 RepID=UPI002B5264FE|nr:HlyD family efflux transporter periplasmic adaptor subunit [Accumulibacter sp.]HNN84274.1 HlyD family efflux transporter periplasmic adaptor subunit [Accumulibacter sp.]